MNYLIVNLADLKLNEYYIVICTEKEFKTFMTGIDSKYTITNVNNIGPNVYTDFLEFTNKFKGEKGATNDN